MGTNGGRGTSDEGERGGKLSGGGGMHGGVGLRAGGTAGRVAIYGLGDGGGHGGRSRSKRVGPINLRAKSIL